MALKDQLNELNNTPDTSAAYDPKDIENNKLYAIISYFWILFLVPLFLTKDSKFARFHCNQGIVSFIATTILGIVSSIFSRIPLIGALVSRAAGIIGLALLVIGVINAAQGKAKELPVIGGIRILK